MNVIDTYTWLMDYSNNKKQTFLDNLDIQRQDICSHLISYFTKTTSRDIHLHLINHGLFLPDRLDKQVIKEMVQRKYWSTVQTELLHLSKIWKGPEIPVFIFPSNFNNKKLRSEFHGLTGLSYQDKLLLFLPNKTTRKRLRALLTHEYNHACRLTAMNKSEDSLTLLDALVLEGLAECAVKKLVGGDYQTIWTDHYSIGDAKKYWNKWIKPNLDIKKTDVLHDSLMYGKRSFPKWVGYNIGYHIVNNYFENNDVSIIEALRTPSEDILKGSVFE